MIRLLAIASLILGGLESFSPTVVVADAPTAIYMFPAGGQRGTEVSFRFGGYDLHDGCPFEMKGQGIVASSRIRPAEKTIWFEGPVIPLPDSQAQESYPRDQIGHVAIAKDASFGFRKARVRNSQGVSNWLNFVIGDLPEVVEDEIDGAPLPVQVQLPITINGRIFPREDVDIWSFEALTGSSYTCEVMAERFGSPLDSHLTLLGPDGRVIIDNEDHFGKDPLLHFTATESGLHQVRIHDVNFGGLQHYVYRLTITDAPYVESIYPLGGKRGAKVAFQVAGQNIPASSVQCTLPDQSPLPNENTWMTQFDVGGEPSNPVLLDLSEDSELLESEPNDLSLNIAERELVQCPIVLNGRIDRNGDIDRWRFAARKNQQFNMEVHASRLGSRLDSVLSVYSMAGKEIATNDDIEKGQSDSKLSFKAPDDAIYEIAIRDRFAKRGGEAYAYRLSLRRSEEVPDFELTAALDFLNVPRKADVKFKVKVLRKNGMTGAISIDVQGLPEGVTVTGNTIADKKNETDLVFHATETAKLDVRELTLVGQSTVAGQPITRPVIRQRTSRFDQDATEITLAVAVPTPFKIFGQFETKYAARGSTFVRHFSIKRGDFEGPIVVSLAERQVRHLQGVTGPTIVIPPGVSEFDYPLHLAPWMEIGRTSRTCLMGVGEIRDADGATHKVSFTSGEQFDQIIVLVDPGQLDIRLDRDSVKATPGGEAELSVTVGRGQGFTGSVKIELITPEHIKCVSASPIWIEQDQKGGKLKLTFANEQLTPFNMPLTIRGTATVSGSAYTAEEKLSVSQ
ncbi:MAG: PPC domain-containing protein [Pirellula sp.]